MLDGISNFKKQICNPEARLNHIASFDKEIKRRWRRDKEESDYFDYAKINCNEDVLGKVERFSGAVRFVENHVERGHLIDDYNMCKALYDALLAIHKMAQNFDNSLCEFHEISPEDVDSLFNKLLETAQRMGDANLRRAMQD